MSTMTEKIQVAVRVQPVKHDNNNENLIHWVCEQGTIVQFEPMTEKRIGNYLFKTEKRMIGNPYSFNHVFGSETRNAQIYESMVQPLIDSAMDGFNTTLLAYGQETSGKTHTMMGNEDELGIVQLAVDGIFDLIEKNTERAYLLRCSFYTIFEETIYDLLDPCNDGRNLFNLNRSPIEVKTDEGHCHIVDLTETNVNTPRDVLKLLEQGNKLRRVDIIRSGNEAHPSKLRKQGMLKKRSYNSQTIFRIIVESVPRVEADRVKGAVIVSHLNFVDLAGSKEGLSNLRAVIGKLSKEDGFDYPEYNKLTHILEDSIGNNARTTFICNIKPTVLHETTSTLKFASSAQTISNRPHVNEIHFQQSELGKNYKTILREGQLVVSSSRARAVGQSENSLTSFKRTTCNPSREKGLNYNAPVLKQPPFVRCQTPRTITELIELECSSEASGNESSPIGVPTLTTHPVVSGHSIGDLHLDDRVMVTSTQGSISSTINISISSDGLGQQEAMDSLGEKALPSGQLAAPQTLATEKPFSSSNMYASGRNGCMGPNGCAQPPTHLLSCPHRMVGLRICFNCIIRIPDKDKCRCKEECVDAIRQDLIEIHD